MALLYLLIGALVVGAVVFGVAALITGSDPGLVSAEPDGSAVPLPADRPLSEQDFSALRFDTGLRGYRMAQVDMVVRRAAYDIGYKEELIAVLEAEVAALRAGRQDEADALQRARVAALRPDEAAEGDLESAEITDVEPAAATDGVEPAATDGVEPAATDDTEPPSGAGVEPSGGAGTEPSRQAEPSTVGGRVPARSHDRTK